MKCVEKSRMGLFHVFTAADISYDEDQRTISERVSIKQTVQKRLQEGKTLTKSILPTT